MQQPLIQGGRLLISLILLLVLPLVIPVNKKEVNASNATFREASVADLHAVESNWHTEIVSSLTFVFGDWIPEGIRSITIRLSSIILITGGLYIFFIIAVKPLPVRPRQPRNLITQPDFVGFLFRLKPF